MAKRKKGHRKKSNRRKSYSNRSLIDQALDKSQANMRYKQVYDILEKSKKNDVYKFWRRFRTTKDRDMYKNIVRRRAIENKKNQLTDRLNKLKPGVRNEINQLLWEIRKNRDKPVSEVINIFAIKQGKDRKYYNDVLTKLGYFSWSDRRQPKKYFVKYKSNAQKAILSALNKQLRVHEGLSSKEAHKWVSQFMKQRINGDEIIWGYKDNDDWYKYREFNQELKEHMRRQNKLSDKQAKNLRDWWKNNYGMYMVNFDPSKIEMEKLARVIVNKKRYKDINKTIHGMIDTDIDYWANRVLNMAVDKGIKYNNFRYKIRSYPNVSYKKIRGWYENMRLKIFNREYSRYARGLLSGKISEEQARFMAEEQTKKELLHLQHPTSYGYSVGSGTNPVHLTINVKGSMFDDKFIPIPDDEKSLGMINDAIKRAVVMNGSVYNISAVDTQRQDHIHISLDLRPDMPLNKIVKSIKGEVEEVLEDDLNVSEEFEWSKGFGFTGSNVGIKNRILAYIRRQQDSGMIKGSIAEDIRDITQDDFGRGKEFISKRKLAFRRQKGRCLLCKKYMGRFDAHHIVPVALGGKNGPIALLHEECHQKVHESDSAK